MAKFIRRVLQDLYESSENISETIFIVPNKRAGVFLKQELLFIERKTQFAPRVFSIEEFIEELSQLASVASIELLFKFYEIYLELKLDEEVDAFDSFSKWARIVIQDFNEIDRHLVEANKIFDYLKAIEKIKDWSLKSQDTSLAKGHAKFWEHLNIYYKALYQALVKQEVGYQGMLYREAVNNLQSFIEANHSKTYVFLGFNALNKAESVIFQELLQAGLANVYWDTDTYFMNNHNHSAGRFIRQYKTTWPYYKNHPFKWIDNNYSESKKIKCVSVPKNIGQAKYIGELLLNSTKTNLSNTAIILGDEQLLTPLITSLPPSVGKLNITMGFPLKTTPIAWCFNHLLKIHQHPKGSFYYKDVIGLLSHHQINVLFKIGTTNFAQTIISEIQSNNMVYVTKNMLLDLTDSPLHPLLEILFGSWKNDVNIALDRCSKLVLYIKEQTKVLLPIMLEHLYKINTTLNTIKELNSKYNYLTSIASLYLVFNEVVENESVDFKGEPLEGLQIMGMLESRVLDFDRIIMTSVNEGVLPSGKSGMSFIPYDVKADNHLPTYAEKDAVYAYHFFRLLQRAKEVILVYNSEPDVLAGGEKSRFITQLEVENLHEIEHVFFTSENPSNSKELKRIVKTPSVVEQIKARLNSGLSPSSLTLYIRNPLDFYYQKILNIQEQDEVEETIAANTLGTVVHETLKELYQTVINQNLTPQLVEPLKQRINPTIKKHFNKVYKKGNLYEGKNLIVYEIAKRYVQNFLDLEISALNQGNTIKVLAVEQDVSTELIINELDYPIILKGQIDRIDVFNGTTRIIDYKTGYVTSGQLSVVDWSDIITDYDKYSKSFQLLTYAWIQYCNKDINLPIEAGMYSFKNLSSGFLPFALKESVRGQKKNTIIDVDVLEAFSKELKTLILEICNPDIDFIEKEV